MDKTQARVIGSNMPVSSKHCREIAIFIKGKEVGRAISLLEDVIAQNVAVPFKRFNRDVGHRPGHVGPGRYPAKASKMVIMLLKSLIANAQNKGLDVNSLYITSAVSNIASRPARYGRQRRRVTKRSHFEIVASEKAVERKSKADQKPQSQKQKNPEQKSERNKK